MSTLWPCCPRMILFQPAVPINLHQVSSQTNYHFPDRSSSLHYSDFSSHDLIPALPLDVITPQVCGEHKQTGNLWAERDHVIRLTVTVLYHHTTCRERINALSHQGPSVTRGDPTISPELPANSSVLLATISCELDAKKKKLFLYFVTQSQQPCSASAARKAARLPGGSVCLKPPSWGRLMLFDSGGLSDSGNERNNNASERSIKRDSSKRLVPFVSAAPFINLLHSFFHSFIQETQEMSPVLDLEREWKRQSSSTLKPRAPGLCDRLENAQSELKKTDWQTTGV